MASDSVPMTRAGYVALQSELKRLKTVERPKIVNEVAAARAHGDLSENAEYHAAREKHSFIEGRIKEIEDKIARAQVIDVSKLSGDKVVFGATVKLGDTETGKEVVYRIVGDLEADLKKGKISISSPIARSLIGREVGDTVSVRSPGGEREYEILDVGFVEEGVAEESE